MASLYKRGNVFWVKYYRPGSRKPIRASLDTDKEPEAKRKLKILEGELAKGNQPDLRIERIRFGHLLDLLLADYRNNGYRSLDTAIARIEGMEGGRGHIRPVFGERRACTINSADIALYIEKRKLEGAKNGTINRELGLIKRAFSIAWRAYRLAGPNIDLMDEHNVRTGFFDRAQLDSLCRHLPDYLVPFARFAFLTGWRTGEIQSLEWRQVDFAANEIRLDPGSTKNDDGRMVKMTREIRALLESVHREPLQPRVFIYRKYEHWPWRPIGKHPKAWKKACKAAGLPGRVMHDFRRSAVRQFIRDGIPERVAMQITGHRTREMFDRYHIISEVDMEEAARKTDVGTEAGTIERFRKAEPKQGGKRRR